MSKACAVAGGVVAALVVVTLAYGQGHAKPGKGAKPKPAASASGDNPYEDRAPPSSPSASGSTPAPAASQATSDAGSAPPPPPPPENTEGGIPSPLNPAANEFSDAGVQPVSVDYDRLLSDIASLRARVAAVSDTLFHSRIAIAIEANGDHAKVASLSVSLDDGVVWTSPSSFRADAPTVVYEHALAPGHHAVTVDVERRDDRSDGFRSAQRSRFTVDVPAEQRLAVDVRVSDDSDMGGDFPSDKKGQYDLRIRARAEARPLGK
jgi:hypothetical protein